MERLTNSKVAENLRHNIAGLRAVGIEPDIDYIRYVRLAELEEAETSDTLLKLATVFEKTQPKYITLEGKQNG